MLHELKTSRVAATLDKERAADLILEINELAHKHGFLIQRDAKATGPGEIVGFRLKLIQTTKSSLPPIGDLAALRKEALYDLGQEQASGLVVDVKATVRGQERPTIGRIVHYVLANGQHRAATVVNCWPSPDPVQASIANLAVSLDGANDLEIHRDETGVGIHRVYVKNNLQPQGSFDLNNGGLSVASAKQDEDTKAPGTWHWPERE